MSGINYEDNFKKIVGLYDVAEELLLTVESQREVNPEAYLEFIEPIVETIEESADVLSTEYAYLAQGSQGKKKINRKIVESALRKIYQSVDDYKERLTKIPEQPSRIVERIVAPVLNRLKAVAEEVVSFFMEVVEISLDKIMHRSEVEEMRKRNQRIAALMHQMALNMS